MAEFDDSEASGFRMLGVDPARQGAGAGRALVQWCIDRAVADGKARILIHSTPWMGRAHVLYERFGFVRRPDLDWTPLEGIELIGFALELTRDT
jgi:GNAT superfamily N-acetyltransferase